MGKSGERFLELRAKEDSEERRDMECGVPQHSLKELEEGARGRNRIKRGHPEECEEVNKGEGVRDRTSTNWIEPSSYPWSNKKEEMAKEVREKPDDPVADHYDREHQIVAESQKHFEADNPRE